jgi:hypothetical protein
VDADDVSPKLPKAPTAVVSSTAKAPPNSTGSEKAPSGALANLTVPQIQSKEPIQQAAGLPSNEEPLTPPEPEPVYKPQAQFLVATEYQSKVIPSHPKVPKTKQEVLEELEKGIAAYRANPKPGGDKEPQHTAQTALTDDVKKLVSDFTDTLKHPGSGKQTEGVVEEAPEPGEWRDEPSEMHAR